MCHAFLTDTRFYQLLLRVDQEIAAEVRAAGCPHCEGALHASCYPRKPRGLPGTVDDTYRLRLSLCCAREGCRRRCTPPSVRFLARKVYLGTIVVLVSALQHGLTARRRRQLVEQLDLWPQTIARWRRWWREYFPGTACWRAARGNFMPPIACSLLPGALLGRLAGTDLPQRLCRLLRLLAPLTTASCPHSVPVGIDPQKM